MVILLALASSLVAGCGGASDGGSLALVRSPVREAPSSPQRSAVDVVRSTDPVSTSHAPSAARFPSGTDNDEHRDTAAGPLRPCRLVTRSEAAAMLGRRMSTSEAPRGPTCIYRIAGSRATRLTLTVETVSLAALRRSARHSKTVRVGGRIGYCLRYAATSVAVPLTRGRVLHVSGPCAVATRFAAVAAPRVPN